MRLRGEEVPGRGLCATAVQGMEEGSAREARKPNVRNAHVAVVVGVGVVVVAAATND